MEYCEFEQIPVVPRCTNEGGHKFIPHVVPAENRSGWHEDICAVCGFVYGYDTTD